MHAIAKALNYDLDEHGVSVIDFQNNGNPESFAVLARALGYPWLIVVDGDDAGKKYIARLEHRGFSKVEIGNRSFELQHGYLEQQLVADGLQVELKSILHSQGKAGVDVMDDNDLVAALVDDKTNYAALLAELCDNDHGLVNRMPLAFRSAIAKLRGLT